MVKHVNCQHTPRRKMRFLIALSLLARPATSGDTHGHRAHHGHHHAKTQHLVVDDLPPLPSVPREKSETEALLRRLQEDVAKERASTESDAEGLPEDALNELASILKSDPVHPEGSLLYAEANPVHYEDEEPNYEAHQHYEDEGEEDQQSEGLSAEQLHILATQLSDKHGSSIRMDTATQNAELGNVLGELSDEQKSHLMASLSSHEL